MLCLMSPEERVPATHPLRGIKKLADAALAELSPTFDGMYASGGRPSVPPERLLKAQLLIALFSVRSDRQFCEQLDYNLLFRWFLDLELDEKSFDASTFSRNRERLIRHEVAEQFLAAVVEEAKKGHLLSADHFSIDGTLIESWASMKSFRPKDGPPGGDSNGWSDFRGEKRTNETHASVTDPDAKLARKGPGREAKLSYAGHVLMENRNGFLMDILLSQADGFAERREGATLVARIGGGRRKTVGGDKGYDATDFVQGCRAAGVTPHVAPNIHRSRKKSAIDQRTLRHEGHRVSQIVRRRIETIFGWLKSFGGMKRSRVRGLEKTQLAARLAAAAYNLLRLSRLQPLEAGT